MKLSKIKLAILSLIFVNIVWGAAFPIYKLTLTNIPPLTFAFLRFFFAAILIFPFVYKNLRVQLRDIVDLLLLSIVGITFTITLINFGLKLSSSINAPIILSAGPIVLIIGSFLYLKEKLKIKVIYGTIVSFIGVLVIVLMPVFSKGFDTSVNGNLFFVFAGIFSVIHTLILKKLLSKYNLLTLTFWSFLLASLPLIPFLFLEYSQTHWLLRLSSVSLSGIIFAVVLATAVCYTLNAYGIKYIAANEVGIFTYVDPIATIIIAIPLLHESISLPYLIGAFLVFGGIFIAEGRIYYHPLHRLFR